MTTLAQAQTMVARDLRDTTNTTFNSAELADLIGQGIDALAAFYPKQIVDDSITLSAGVYNYTLPTGMSEVFRVDVYDATTLRATLPPSDNGTGSGWEVFEGALWLPPQLALTSGDILRVWGYGPWTAISANSSSSSVLDVDASALWAVRVFCRVEGFKRVTFDRAKYQQWQQTPGNTDVSALALAQLSQAARRDWQDEITRLRKPRKTA